MKNLLSILTVMLLAFSSISVFAKTNEKETIVLTVNPPMTCQNCENKIKSNIRFEKGVNNIKTDLKGQTVTIVFEPSKTDKEHIIQAFKKIGYTATDANSPIKAENKDCGDNCSESCPSDTEGHGGCH